MAIKSKESFIVEARHKNTKEVARGDFANGFTALVWKRDRTIFAKLFDRDGNLVGDQYGDSKCPFYDKWTFYYKDTYFEFNIVG
jgi:hypothetical protein